MCGLKYLLEMDITSEDESHPLRMCGLKYDIVVVFNRLFSVTSLTDVWIEILKYYLARKFITVTSLTDVWIEIIADIDLMLKPASHIPYGCVD